ncbi:hypothetical protein SEVIR_1G297901v4 [Setaria viridis]
MAVTQRSEYSKPTPRAASPHPTSPRTPRGSDGSCPYSRPGAQGTARPSRLAIVEITHPPIVPLGVHASHPRERGLTGVPSKRRNAADVPWILYVIYVAHVLMN